MKNIIYKEEAFKIQGACFEVHNELGCGFLESVYQEALSIEFEMAGIPFLSQPELELKYKNRTLDSKFKPDFLCYDKIVIELKAVAELHSKHTAQLLNYLKATKNKLGILVNFGDYPRLKIKRIVSPEYFLK